MLDPGLTLGRFAQAQPYRDETVIARIVQDLRTAGLPLMGRAAGTREWLLTFRRLKRVGMLAGATCVPSSADILTAKSASGSHDVIERFRLGLLQILQSSCQNA